MRRPKIVERISNTMRLHFPEVETILYGSEARGDARIDSDFDLLLLIPDETPSYSDKLFQIGDRMVDIELDEGVNISTLLYRKKEWGAHRTPFYYNVINEGIRL